MAGLDQNGFKRKRLADIRSELQDKWRELFGENSRVDSGINGKIISLMAWALSIVWQLAERVYNNGFVHKASGKSLDNLVNNRLMRRRPAESADGEIEITGEEDTEVESGFIVSNGDTDYSTTQTVTIDSSGSVTVAVEADEAGSDGNTSADTVTEIVTPLVGIDSVTNPDPISGGRDEETDAELKERYDLSQSTGNSPSANGIRAEVLGVEGVRTATVVENLDLEEDGEGRPGRSYETYVLGGADEDIAQAIFRRRAAGTRPYGDTTINVEDDSGNTVPVGFTPANQVDVYFDIELETNNEYPSDGDDLVTTSLIQYIGGLDEDGNEYTGLGMGQDVIYTKMVSIIHNINGVEEVTKLEVSTDDSTYNTDNISINPTQVAITDYNKVVIA